MSNKVPLAVKISTLALIAILVLYLFSDVLINHDGLKQNLEFFQASAEQSLDSIRSDLASGNIAHACEIMQKARDRKLFSFFIIQAAGLPVCYDPKQKVDSYFLNYHEFDVVVHDANGNFDFKSIKNNGAVATAGWLNDSRNNLFSFIKLNLPQVFLGILISVTAVAVIVFRETRLIKKLLNVFKRSEKVAGHLEGDDRFLRGHASEVRQLWQSAYELERRTERLKNEVQFVAQDAQNFLRREVALKNEKIPYRFFSTLLRFDMNNYTKTFLVDAEATQALILRLSIESDELVHRYDGLHYGFGGDEFIIVFLDNDRANSKALALACLRDIFFKVEEIFTAESSYGKISLKASLSHSDNVLFELPNGLFLRGLNLILSQRYLTTVASKEKNRLVVNRVDRDELLKLSSFNEPRSFTLKGISENFELCELNEFVGLKSIVASQNFSDISFFRSDEDICFLLKSLNSNEVSASDKMRILSHLKSFEVHRAQAKVAESFMDCFKKLDQDIVSNKNLISSLLNAGENVVPTSSWSNEMSEMLLNSNCKKDSRCNSAILRLLSLKASQESFDRFADQILAEAHGPDFRSKGNFLIAKAKNSFSDEVLNECGRMLKSKNGLEVATGIYVAARIIQGQRELDPVALSQFEMVSELIRKIDKLRGHDDLMIRSRANIEFRELNQGEHL